MKRLACTRLAGITLALSLAAGCVHAPTEQACARFGAATYCLQPPAASFAVTQSIEMSPARLAGDGDMGRLIVHLEVRGDDIAMVGLTPFGRRVLQVRYDGNRVTSDVPRDAPISAERILAGMQLAAWPLERARAGLRGTTAQLLQTPDGRGRELRDGANVVFRAACEGERPTCRRVELRYETLGQTLRIETLEIH